MYKIQTIVILFVLFLGSCKKSQTDISSNHENDYRVLADTTNLDSFYWSVGVNPSLVTYTFYMDGEAFDPESTVDYSTNYPVINAVYNESDQSLDYICNLFTTEQGYIDYGDQHNLPLSELIEFEDEIGEYGNWDELQAIIDGGGTLPQSYIDHEQTAYDAAFWWFPNPVWLVIYDDIVPYGSSKNMFFKYLPTLKQSKNNDWNNKVGCIKLTQGYNFVALYDKTGYRSHLATVHGWQNAVFTFAGSGNLWWVNDRTESIVIQ